MGFITSGKTIDDVTSWVLDKVLHDRDHYDFALDAAMDAYHILCGAIPFETLWKTSDELALTADQGVYDLDTFIEDSIAGIVSVRLAVTSTQHRRLKRSHPSVFDRISTPTTGQPALYARMGNTIELHPVPSMSSYTLRFRYWKYPTIEEDPEDTALEIPKEWVELLKWETLYRVYSGPAQRPDAAMALVTPAMLPDGPSPRRAPGGYAMGILPRLWNHLCQTIQQREHIDEDFSVNPVQRNYTSSPFGW